MTDKDYELALQEHYNLVVDVFPVNGETIATGTFMYEDLQTALNAYLYLFLKCDFVKRCTLHKHVPHVPLNLYLCSFTRTKEFKNFLPLPLDKPPYYVYNKEVLEYLFAKVLNFAKAKRKICALQISLQKASFAT